MKDNFLKKGRVNQKLNTRDKILSATQSFLNKGKEFTLEEVAEKAGISRATIYRYYSSIEVLVGETELDIHTKNPETLCEDLEDIDIETTLINVQDYYNTLTLEHEEAFRKYLSLVITGNSSKTKRGARRIKTLKLVLKNSDYTKQEKEKLTKLFTVLMGIEPLTVTKDVCGLNDKQSKKLLQWGMELILKGLSKERET